MADTFRMDIPMPKIALASPHTLPFHCGNSILVERLRTGLERSGYIAMVYNTGQRVTDDAVTFSPDILHTFHADKSRAWAETFLSKRRVPWIISLTGTDYNGWHGTDSPPPRIRKCLQRASALVVFHRQAAREVAGAVPEIADKIRVIAQGVSRFDGTEDRRSLRGRFGMGCDQVVFLMVAGIRPVKNIGLALEAFGEMESRIPLARLLLVGPAMDRREADRIADMGRRLRCFSYLGERSPSEVRELMRASDVLLNTSLHEGMPGTLLEAMAEGLPVLAGAVSGNTSLVRDGENGVLFNPEDREELVGKALRLAGDARLRASLGQAGRNWVHREFSAEREREAYHDLYASLLSNPDRLHS